VTARVEAERVQAEGTAPIIPVARVFRSLTRVLGTDRAVEESADTGEPSDPVLFPSRVGSSRAPGATLGDTLEAATDESLARSVQDFPELERVLVGQTPPAIVQDAEREERQAEEAVHVTIVDEVRRVLRDRPPFTPESYVLRLHFIIPLGCETYEPQLPFYPEDQVLWDSATHMSNRTLVCI
jgi:hypothetical protein